MLRQYSKSSLLSKTLFALPLLFLSASYGQNVFPSHLEWGIEDYSKPRLLRDKRAGVVMAAQGEANASLTSIAIQTDGKILGAGYYSYVQGYLVVRLNSNGTLDPSFNKYGSQRFTMGGTDLAYAVLQQHDGKIFVGGGANNFSDTGVARFDSSGNFDLGFRTTGKDILASGTSGRLEYAKQQANHKLVFLGSTWDNQVAVVRLNSDGAFDTSFFTGGSRMFDFSTGQDSPRGLELHDDGSLSVAALVDGPSTRLVLFRFNSDGNYNTSFNTTGSVEVSPATAVVSSMKDGDKTMVAFFDGGADKQIRKYLTDGTLDSSFFTDGIKIVPTSSLRTIFPSYQNLIVQIGSDGSGGIVLVRYHSNGDVDTSFSTVGTFTFTINGFALNVEKGETQPDGKIVLAGSDGSNHMYFVRFNTNGTIDSSFNSIGHILSGITPHNTMTNSLYSEGNKIYLAGDAATLNGEVDASVIKFHLNGQLDISFATEGKLRITHSGADTARSVNIQTDGKLFLIHQDTSEGSSNLRRYNTNGSLDTSFNTGLPVNIAGSLFGETKLQIDGKTVTYGYNASSKIVRLLTNGNLDPTFGTNGVYNDPLGANYIRAGAIQTDGKIIGAGISNSEFFIARLTTNGILDTSFNTIGANDTVVESSASGIAQILIQSDGKVIGIGSPNADFGIVRYTTNGTFDTSFSLVGYSLVDFGGYDIGAGIAQAPNGKTVAVGACVVGGKRACMLRLNSNGTLDTTFGTQGTMLLSVGTGTSGASGISILQDGSYLVGGTAINEIIHSGFLIRVAP